MCRTVSFLLSLSYMSCGAVHAAEPLLYERDIRPIFRAHCFDCHGSTEDLQGGLDLRQVRRMRVGGESGPAIEPGDPDGSYLLQRLRDREMPPGAGKVADEDIERIATWISAGAPTARSEPDQIGPGLGITAEERSFWSFQPIQRPHLETVVAGTSLTAAVRARTPIDLLIISEMPPGLRLSDRASRFTLIRRAYFDLLGIPPSPQALRHWLRVEGPDWFSQLLDHLLSSPQYGERWARHWLDVVGYADSEGYTVSDTERKWAWPYRDWVIRALNEDCPVDQFLTEQLAGDEMVGEVRGDLTPRQVDLLTATGFLRMAADGTGSGANTAAARNQVVADTLKIVSTSLFGLSVQCAQCHDHRYDPIPQTDYYALRAVFEPALNWNDWQTPSQRLVSLYTSQERQRAAEIEQQAQQVVTERRQRQEVLITAELQKILERVEDTSMREPLRAAYRVSQDQRTEQQKQLLAAYPFVRQLSAGSLYLYNSQAADELKAIDARIAQIRATKPPEEFRRVLQEPARAELPVTRLFFRGDHQQPQQPVPPAGLSVVADEGHAPALPDNDASRPSSGRRLAFARQLTDGKHPLMARVIANRVWMHHFGRGLVSTPADFGRLGSRPTHPRLLDWLADELVSNGWSLNRLHRVIMQSAVWRQRSRTRADATGRLAESLRIDPDNRFYWRKPLVRLEAEAIRDRMLASAGQLQVRMYGPPVDIREDETGQVDVANQQTRRSIYIQRRRSRPVAMLQTFDAPVMETNCECRKNSTVATQSLMLVNGQFTLQLSAQLAARVERECKACDESAGLAVQIGRIWQYALQRPPDATELELAIRLVTEQRKLLEQYPGRRQDDVSLTRQVMTHLCQSLLICNEFLYID